MLDSTLTTGISLLLTPTQPTHLCLLLVSRPGAVHFHQVSRTNLGLQLAHLTSAFLFHRPLRLKGLQAKTTPRSDGWGPGSLGEPPTNADGE